MVGYVLFILSAGLLCGCCALAARFGRDWAERFWIFVAAGLLQLGALTSGLSLVGALEPVPWLIAQGGIVLVMWSIAPARRRLERGSTRDLVVIGCFVVIGVMAAVTGVERFVMPISHVDDRNYYASRAAYWMQHRDALHFETHNERQVVFPLGQTLPFFWAVLFTRDDYVGQFVFWLAYPLCAVGVYLLARRMDVKPRGAAIAAAVFAFTPAVLFQTVGAHSELWMALCVMGCAWAVLPLPPWERAKARAEGREGNTWLLAGALAALAVDMRITALPVLGAVMLVPLVSGRARGLGWVVAGIVGSTLLNGWALTLVENARHFGNPLGPSAIRRMHGPDYSAKQVATHTGRFVAALLEPPLAGEEVRQFWRRGLERIGLDEALPMEDQNWPGSYKAQLKGTGEFYSLAGVFWLGALAAGSWVMLRDAGRSFPGVRLSAPAIVMLIELPLLAGVVFGIRWMGLMPRFWVGPYALGVVLIVYFAGPLVERWRGARVVAVVFLAAFALGSAAVRVERSAGVLRQPIEPVALDQPYYEALANIPAGSTILLVAGQGTSDYPLFGPREGFTNRVISWGIRPYSEGRLKAMLERGRVDRVLVENDQAVDLHWRAPVDTRGLVEAMRANPEFEEIALNYSPGQRLFARRGTGR